jgi:CRISPR-associated protein Csx17
MVMAEIVLAGCAPIPLASYLKALGIFRLVAEQKDKTARGRWRLETFVLDTALTEEDLVRFFLDEYRPTPIISPWNGGSGFFPNDNKLGIRPIAEATAGRFSAYKEAIAAAHSILKQDNIVEKPDGAQKDAIRAQFRAKLRDCALAWYDAAILLTQTGFLTPPLLGSGGNDGRTDFSNNFMCRLTDLFDTKSGEPSDIAERSLKAALYAELSNSLIQESKASIDGSRKEKLLAIGQFGPGASGGANATVGFERDTLINPWDYVLLIEGTLLFAASSARRLQSSKSAGISYPFTVSSTSTDGAGGSLTDEKRKSKGKFVGDSFEIWMPLWETPASLPEINALFSEGRATLGRRPVGDGLDFARAVAALGVNRGISAFERYAFLQRRGDAISATPKGRIRVQPRPKARLLSDLDADTWLTQFRQYARKLDAQSKNFVAPRQLQTLALRLDEAIFAMTQEDSPQAVQRVLIAVGEAAAYLASSPKARDPNDGKQKPPPPLGPKWFQAANDCSAEFRIAAALAGLGRAQQTEKKAANTGDEADVADADENDIQGSLEGVSGEDIAAPDTSAENERGPTPPPPFRAHLAPLDEKTWYGRLRAWSDRDGLAVWGAGALERNLIAVAERRLVFASRRKLDGGPFDARAPADLASVLAFLWRETDDEKVAGLAQGLAWANAPNFIPTDAAPSRPLPLAYALIKPLFAPIADVCAIAGMPEDIRLPVPPGLIARLRAGDVGAAMTLACRRARGSGLPITFEPRREDAAGIDGPRLLAALLIPIRRKDLKYVMQRAYPRLFDSMEPPQPKEDAADAA